MPSQCPDRSQNKIKTQGDINCLLQQEDQQLTATWCTQVYWELIGPDMSVRRVLCKLNGYLVLLRVYWDPFSGVMSDTETRKSNIGVNQQNKIKTQVIRTPCPHFYNKVCMVAGA